jgi:hypothetical protein
VQHKEHGQLDAHQYGAYTDVDVLVKRLIGHSVQIRWYVLDEVFQLDSLQCKVVLNEGRPEVLILNKGKSAIVFNQQNISRHISVNGRDGFSVNLEIENTIQINPGEEKELVLLLPIKDYYGIQIDFVYGTCKAIIMLATDL